MKKAKLVFIAIALVAGIGGAFATRPDPGCEGTQQYYWGGGGYVPIQGQYGVTWYCISDPSVTCSYYRPNPMNAVYVACRIGLYRPVF
jgi:hypothetical protein